MGLSARKKLPSETTDPSLRKTARLMPLLRPPLKSQRSGKLFSRQSFSRTSSMRFGNESLEGRNSARIPRPRQTLSLDFKAKKTNWTPGKIRTVSDNSPVPSKSVPDEVLVFPPTVEQVQLRSWTAQPEAQEVASILGRLIPVKPPQISIEKKSVVIMLLERVRGGPVLMFRSETFSALSYIQLQHHLVLISEMKLTDINQVMKILEDENILPAAVYQISPSDVPTYRWGLDYSSIYRDFGLSEKCIGHCVIVSVLAIDGLETSDLTQGTHVLRSHCVRMPVPTIEYSDSPVTVLIPHIALKDSGSSSMVLLSLLINAISRKHGFLEGFRNLDFQWVDKIHKFPYGKLWLGTFHMKEQMRGWEFLGKMGFDPAKIIVIKGKHVKPNFEVVHHKSAAQIKEQTQLVSSYP